MRQCLAALSVLSILLIVVPPSRAQEPQKMSCYKSFQVTAMGKDGYKDFTMTLRHQLKEKPGFDEALEEVDSVKVYQGSLYTVQPETATTKVNCAGYVMNKLFNTGEADVDLGYHKASLLDQFARITTGPPQPGDVVMFGDNHIALVIEPSSSNSYAIIESKDNEQSVVKGKVSLTYAAQATAYVGLSGDPIVHRHGTPVVYRFVNKPQFQPVASGDCDPPDVTGNWEDERGIVYTLKQTMDPDGTVRVTGTLAGSARSGHPSLTGTLTAKREGSEWTGTFRNQEPDSAGRIVWSDGQIFFKISEDGDHLDGRAPATLHWDNNTRPLDIQLRYQRKR